MFLLCKFKNGELWFCESTNNVMWVTNNCVSWLFRLSRASPTMDGSGDAQEWFDEKQTVEERTLWYFLTFSSTSPARNLTGLAQSLCHKDMQGSGLSRTIMPWCYALLCSCYITQGYGCHSLHWVAFGNTQSVVCFTVIPLLCGQCTNIRKVSLRQTFADYDVADVIAFAI